MLGGQFLLPLKVVNGKRKREFSKPIRHMNRNFALRRRLDSYHVMVDKEEAADILLRTAPPQGKKWSAFLKIDCGNKGPYTNDVRNNLVFLHFFQSLLFAFGLPLPVQSCKYRPQARRRLVVRPRPLRRHRQEAGRRGRHRGVPGSLRPLRKLLRCGRRDGLCLRGHC